MGHWNLSEYWCLEFGYSSFSDRSDLLAHKDEIADAEGKKRDRHNRDQMGNHNDDALRQGKRILETGQRNPFEGSH